MPNPLRLALLAWAGLLAGCSSASAPPASVVVARGPHHGTMIRLPEDQGFVELVNEPEPRDRRSTEPTALVAYFLKADAQSAIDPLPTEVTFTIDRGGGRDSRARKSAPQVVPLSPESKADDRAGAGRFASQPGPFQLAGLRGLLNAKIKGQPVSTVFAGDR